MTTKENAGGQAGEEVSCASKDSTPRSLRGAINATCRQCIHDAAAPGTWREQVAQCTVTRCGLWPVRPAPSGGPFADPPRDPAGVSRDWLARPVGRAETGHRRTVATTAGGGA